MERVAEVGFLLAFYGKLLTEKQEDMMHQYFDEDQSLAEIAENAGVSRQAVHDIINRSEHKLREYEDKLRLAKQFQMVIGELEEIRADVQGMAGEGEQRQQIVDKLTGLIEKWEE